MKKSNEYSQKETEMSTYFLLKQSKDFCLSS